MFKIKINEKIKKIAVNIIIDFFTLCFFFKGIFFFIKKKNVKTKNVFLMCQHSFAWQIIDLYALSNYKINHKDITIIQVLFPRNNSEAHNFFFKNVNHKFFYKSDSLIKNRGASQALIWIIKIITKFKFFHIKNIEKEELYSYFKTKKKHFYKLKSYNLEKKKVINYVNLLWLDDLVKKKNFDLKETNLKNFDFCNKLIKSRLHLSSKSKLGSIIFRNNFSNHQDDVLRSMFKPKNYIAGLKWLIRFKKYTFINHNKNYDHIFKSTNGIVNLSEITNNRKEFDLLNLYLCYVSNLFLAQHSGSHIMPFIFKKKMILCDAWPYNLGVPKKKDIVLFTNIKYKNKFLSPLELTQKKHYLAFLGKVDDDYKLVSNSKNQILSTLKEKNLKNLSFSKQTLAGHREFLTSLSHIK
jgi:putative glycosyltransferase (TIGR04372 family)